MHSSQVSGHVVFSIEFLVANLAGIGVPLQMGRDIVSVKVAWVGIGVVAHFAAISVLWWSFICAKTSNADWCRVLG